MHFAPLISPDVRRVKTGGIRRVGRRVQAWLLSLSVVCLPAAVLAADYQVGVYYFPGWRSGLKAAPAIQPWERIKTYPEREPLLGWYDDGDPEVMNTQLGWMRDHAISYIVFDWYWGRRGTTLEHGLQAYFKSANRADVPFSLLWANHDDAPTSRADFSAMVQYWVDQYFKRPEFFRVDGRPVVFIFDHAALEAKAKRFDASVNDLIKDAEVITRNAGLPPIYFVGSTFNAPRASTFGYQATSTYNYHGIHRPSRSYRELINDYAETWRYQTGRHGVPYIVPMTQGWDRRPWGGSKDPLHDNSGGDPAQFEIHLRAAKAFMDERLTDTRQLGVICCWNEFGEGSYIEPTKMGGFAYLQKIKAVFGAKARR